MILYMEGKEGERQRKKRKEGNKVFAKNWYPGRDRAGVL